MFVVTAVALVGLIVFVIGAITLFDPANLVDIAPTDAAGASPFLPFGVLGIWAAVPFAIWFFLAVEGVPLAAEEARDPARNVPRGIVVSMLVLIVTGACVLVLATGALGASALSESGNPLVEALGTGPLAVVVNYIGLAGLVASFFSIIYAYSRQTFALSRAGYLPRVLSVTNGRKAPTLALIVPGIIGFALSLTGQGNVLLNMAVFGAALSYVLMMVSHIVLRRREPGMERPYRTPGGVATTGFALVVAVIAVVATFLVDLVAALCTLGAFALFMAYFAFYCSAPPGRRAPRTRSSPRCPTRRRNCDDGAARHPSAGTPTSSPTSPRCWPRRLRNGPATCSPGSRRRRSRSGSPRRACSPTCRWPRSSTSTSCPTRTTRSPG